MICIKLRCFEHFMEPINLKWSIEAITVFSFRKSDFSTYLSSFPELYCKNTLRVQNTGRLKDLNNLAWKNTMCRFISKMLFNLEPRWIRPNKNPKNTRNSGNVHTQTNRFPFLAVNDIWEPPFIRSLKFFAGLSWKKNLNVVCHS